MPKAQVLQAFRVDIARANRIRPPALRAVLIAYRIAGHPPPLFTSRNETSPTSTGHDPMRTAELVGIGSLVGHRFNRLPFYSRLRHALFEAALTRPLGNPSRFSEHCTVNLRIGGIVLCGGLSRRMGSPKEWLPCGGEYLLQRMVRIVSSVVQPVVVSARPGQHLPELPSDIGIVFDRRPDHGPLAGLSAGLEALANRCEAAFVVPCDHPLLRPEWVKRLVELLGEHPAVMPVHEGQAYPLTAVYRTSLRPMLDQQLQQRNLAALRFAETVGALFVESDGLVETDPNLDSLRNINHPEDLAKIFPPCSNNDEQ